MNIKTLGLVALSGIPMLRPVVAAYAQHQKEVLQVMCLLAGKHRYAAVEAAIDGSGIPPYGIYQEIAAGQRTPALERFYEALGQ